jgi:protein-disulfide isomerase
MTSMAHLFKQLIVGALSSVFVLGAAYAQTAQKVDVVKIMSFSCSYCRAAEGPDNAIESAVKSTGGRFVRAPVPTGGEEDRGVRERVYYAARDMDPQFGERVKNSLYKGAQDAGISLVTLIQNYTWITQDLPDDESKVRELFHKAQDISTERSLARAAQLATNAGVQNLPSYILLVDGSVKAVFDNDPAGGSINNLRNSVISTIEKLSAPNDIKPTP